MTRVSRRISRPDLRVPHRPGRGRRRPVAACPVRSTAVTARPPIYPTCPRTWSTLTAAEEHSSTAAIPTTAGCPTALAPAAATGLIPTTTANRPSQLQEPYPSFRCLPTGWAPMPKTRPPTGRAGAKELDRNRSEAGNRRHRQVTMAALGVPGDVHCDRPYRVLTAHSAGHQATTQGDPSSRSRRTARTGESGCYFQPLGRTHADALTFGSPADLV